MLSGKTRNRFFPFRPGTMAGRASRYACVRHPLFIDCPALRHECFVAGRPWDRLLSRIVCRELLDVSSVQLRRHSPHVRLRSGVPARSVVESRQLRFDVSRLLAGAPREGWGRAVAFGPVARGADLRRETFDLLVLSGVSDRRNKGERQRNSYQNTELHVGTSAFKTQSRRRYTACCCPRQSWGPLE